MSLFATRTVRRLVRLSSVANAVGRSRPKRFRSTRRTGALLRGPACRVRANEQLEFRQMLTVISDHITDDIVWTRAGSPYEVTTDIDVQEQATLRIEPGVDIQFQAGAGIDIMGRMVAEGQPESRIQFRPVNANRRWDGLKFEGTLHDNRITYANMDFGDNQGEVIDVDHARLLLDHVVWTRVSDTILELEHPSLIVRNSTFPTSGGEVIHGEQLAGDEYLIIEGNTFANSDNGADVLDFLGADRPGPVVQVVGNVFLGGGDDGLDLDGTDAHIEGNVFMNFSRNTGRNTTSNAIATGAPQTGADNRTEITVVRNVFINNDHAILLKEDAFATVQHNVFWNSLQAVVQFDERNGTLVLGPGKGAAFQGNIFGNNRELFKNLVDRGGFRTELTVDQSLLPNEAVDFDGTSVRAHDLGADNLGADPLFVDPANHDFRLLPGSPARERTRNGLDLGAYVAATPTITPLASLTADGQRQLQVGGPGITHYRYRVGAGPLSDLTPVGDPIPLDGAATRPQVRVWGMNSAGQWVTDSSTALGRSTEWIAPRAVHSGQSLPIVARALNWQQQVDSTIDRMISTPATNALANNQLVLKRGVAAHQSTVTATNDFSLDGETTIDVIQQPLPVVEVAGSIDEDTTWRADREYQVTGGLSVQPGRTLTIEAGTRVRIASRTNVRIRGTLRSLGTADQPVWFSSLDPGQSWGGLEFVDAGDENRLEYTFLTHGGGDARRAVGHSNSQPVVLSTRSTVTCDNCFVMHNTGKGFAASDGRINIWNSVVANNDTGGEFIASVADIRNTWVINIPDSQQQFVDDDNDGFYFSGLHDSGEPSRFVHSFVINTKDDGLDHNGARLEVQSAWIEGAFHEGIASSNRNWVTIDDSVFTRNNQGIEAGYGSPDVTVAQSVIIGNRNQIDPSQPIAAGIRFGDSYDGSIGAYRGHITGSSLVVFDNIDNLRNHDGTIPGPQPGAVEIRQSLINDDDPEWNDPSNIASGVPVLSETMHLLRGSPGFTDGPEGMPIGRAIPFVVWQGTKADLNQDGEVNVADIDAFCAQLHAGGAANDRFDLDGDGRISNQDRDKLILDLIGTSYGDANLDGLFNSSDLVAVFVNGHYEDPTQNESGWADGDWNCDGRFDSRDIVLAFQQGDYVP